MLLIEANDKKAYSDSEGPPKEKKKKKRLVASGLGCYNPLSQSGEDRLSTEERDKEVD